MKVETARRYVREIADRVHAVNGLLATPVCDYEAARISRIWVFGSTIKGAQRPNDLDLLIEINGCGRRLNWRQAKVDKRYLRAYGMRCAPSSTEAAMKWLTKGMKKVSRHNSRVEAAKID